MSSLKSKWWTFLLLKQSKLLLVGIFLSLIFSMTIGYVTPRMTSAFYSSLTTPAEFEVALWSLVLILLAEVGNRILYAFLTNKYVQLLIQQVRQNCFDRWINAPMKKEAGSSQEDFPMGEILARLMNDTDAVKELVTAGAFEIVIDLAFIFSSLAGFLSLDSSLGLYLFIAEIILCGLLFLSSQWMAKVFMEVRKVTSKLARVVTDLVGGLRELYFHPHQKYATKRGDSIFEEFLSKQLKANIWDASYYSAADSLYPILLALVIFVVPYSHVASVAVFAVLLDLIQRSINPIKEVAGKVSVIQRGKTGLTRLVQFYQHFEEDIEREQTVIQPSRLKFSLDKFQYDKKMGQISFELKNIHFEMNRGELLGILGESGCGKSTLLKLISAQYGSFAGSITFDENKKMSFNSKEELCLFQPYVSLVSQDSHVFTETFKFNIGLGVEEGIEEFWHEAQKRIPYLIHWGKKLDDPITPEQLSHGQKQLIAGLRALYRQKPLILLDEISTGLDPQLELAFRDLLHHYRKDVFFIIVTHRLETIMGADKLLLLKNGEVCDFGTQSEMRKSPHYQKFLSHL